MFNPICKVSFNNYILNLSFVEFFYTCLELISTLTKKAAYPLIFQAHVMFFFPNINLLYYYHSRNFQ